MYYTPQKLYSSLCTNLICTRKENQNNIAVGYFKVEGELTVSRESTGHKHHTGNTPTINLCRASVALAHGAVVAVVSRLDLTGRRALSKISRLSFHQLPQYPLTEAYPPTLLSTHMHTLILSFIPFLLTMVRSNHWTCTSPQAY